MKNDDLVNGVGMQGGQGQVTFDIKFNNIKNSLIDLNSQ